MSQDIPEMPERVPLLTLPLFPYLPEGGTEIQASRRLRHRDALNLHELAGEMRKSAVCTIRVNNNPWSVINVFSPYSEYLHVMLMETSGTRYLPGPEAIPEREGEGVVQIVGDVLEFMEKEREAERLCWGYNWSPRAWGEDEERGGFQSIPTEWHAMMWGWRELNPDRRGSERTQWKRTTELPHSVRRILGQNNYALPISKTLYKRLRKNLETKCGINEIVRDGKWNIDRRGITLTVPCSVGSLSGKSGFFSNFLKPVADIINRFFCDLSEAMTSMDCGMMDSILMKTEKAPLSREDFKTLREGPLPRSDREIRKNLERSGFPVELKDILLPPVRNRHTGDGERGQKWRKGFGYSLVFSGKPDEDISEMRFLPGVYMGPGGVVEALGVLVWRLEDREVPEREVRERSKRLWRMAGMLEEKRRFDRS
jgi:hypothetical protein